MQVSNRSKRNPKLHTTAHRARSQALLHSKNEKYEKHATKANREFKFTGAESENRKQNTRSSGGAEQHYRDNRKRNTRSSLPNSPARRVPSVYGTDHGSFVCGRSETIRSESPYSSRRRHRSHHQNAGRLITVFGMGITRTRIRSVHPIPPTVGTAPSWFLACTLNGIHHMPCNDAHVHPNGGA